MMMIPFVNLLAQNGGTCNLPKPNKLKVTNITTNQALVSWDKVTNANGYQLEIILVNSTNPSTNTAVFKQNVNDLSFLVTNLLPNQNYNAKVSAICQNNKVSTNSSTEKFQTDIVIISDVVMIAKPTLGEPVTGNVISLDTDLLLKLNASNTNYLLGLHITNPSTGQITLTHYGQSNPYTNVQVVGTIVTVSSSNSSFNFEISRNGSNLEMKNVTKNGISSIDYYRY